METEDHHDAWVTNPFGQFAGTTGCNGMAICWRDTSEPGVVNRYTIVSMEPNDHDPTTIDVVTEVTATGYYTRQLRLPKGVTFGDPVFHGL